MSTNLTERQIKQLDALRNRPTYYEVTITRACDGERRLLCYTARKTGRGLREGVWNRGEEVMAFLGMTVDDGRNTPMVITKGARETTIGTFGTVAFSGRTKRDVIMQATPLPYLTD